MRNILFLLVFASSLFTVNAKYINLKQARDIALVLMKEKHKQFIGKVESISALNQDPTTSIYIVNFAPQGWMLLSSDDSTLPLLAYSKEGTFKKDCELPINMQSWLKLYSNQIIKISSMKLEPLPAWNLSSRLSMSNSRAIASPIDPLIKVEWNQPDPFNLYCPTLGDQRTLVGCVAVAMGQALSVLKYPARPIGKHSYISKVPVPPMDFDKEEPYDWDKISNGKLDNYKEVARFLYHLGISVDMDYGLKASGTYTELVPEALYKYFSFPDDLTFQLRDNFKGDWNQFIINELGAGRPLIYSGSDLNTRTGHAFNIDGYDGDGMYHVNWGWGGVGNAYYTLDALRDQMMGLNYMANQGAVIGLRYPSNAPTNILLSNHSVPSGERPGQLVGKLSVSNQQPDHEYEYLVRGKYDKINGIYNEVPFKIVGDEIHTSASLSASSKQFEVEIVAIDKTINVSLKQGFLISITGNSEAIRTIEETSSLSFSKETRQLMISSNEGVSYKIQTEDGLTILSGTFSSKKSFVWDTKEHEPGDYIILLTNPFESKSFKVRLNSNK